MKRDEIVAAIAMGLIVLASMLRPGDAQMLDDEPNLLHRAFRANSTPSHVCGIELPFSIAQRGLMGSRNVAYGPAAVWAYQLLLVMTHNPVTMVALRAMVVNAATAVALWWLARTMGVSVWLALVVMMSPWLWLYSRQLWDNSFCIPLSALAVAAYGDFLVRRRGWALILAGACAIVAVLVHLMALALIVPLLAHLAFFEYREIWKFKWALLLLCVIVTGFAWPYLQYLKDAHSTVSPNASIWKGLLYPLQGAHPLTAAGMDEVLGPGWFNRTGPASYLLVAAQKISLAGYGAVWVGIILAAARAGRAVGDRRRASVVDHLSLVAIGVLVCQSALDGYMRAYDGPHYFNATWIAYAVFALLACDWVMELVPSGGDLKWTPVMLYAVALVLIVAFAAATIARDGGSRDLVYGSSLSQQMAAARKIEQFSADSPRTILLEQWIKYPGALTLFPELDGKPARSDLPQRKLIVRFKNAYPLDARIVVEDRPL